MLGYRSFKAAWKEGGQGVGQGWRRKRGLNGDEGYHDGWMLVWREGARGRGSRRDGHWWCDGAGGYRRIRVFTDTRSHSHSLMHSHTHARTQKHTAILVSSQRRMCDVEGPLAKGEGERIVLRALL